MSDNRREKIIEIIRSKKVYTQTELLNLLSEEGYEVTQATISRDIRDLGLTKPPIKNGRSYYIDTNYIKDKVIKKGLFESCVKEIKVAQNLVIIKTNAGAAMVVAAEIDKLSDELALGCIAGDDTIFIATENNSRAIELEEKFDLMIREDNA